MLIDITDTVQLTHTAAEVDEDIDGSVRGDVAQLKDDTWKAQARENIGAIGGSGGGNTEIVDDEFISKVSTHSYLAKIKKLTGKSVVQNNAIVDTDIKGFGSTGKNILNPLDLVNHDWDGRYPDIRWSTLADKRIHVTPGTEFTIKFTTTSKIGLLSVQIFDVNGNMLHNTGWIPTNPYTFTVNYDGYLNVVFGGYLNQSWSVFNLEDIIESRPMIEYGSASTPYEPHNPYYRNFPIVLRSAGNVADEVEDTGNGYKVTRRVGTVDLGTLTWSFRADESMFYSSFSGHARVPFGIGALPNGVCAKYAPAPPESQIDKTWKFTNDSDNVYVNDTAYTDVTAFKTAMNGVMLNYELATPIVEYHDYNLTYPVTENGTEYFDSPISVPCEIEYGIDVINDIVSGVIGGDTERDNGSYDLLWENASPNSSFGGQIVNVDLTRYSKVLIVFHTFLYSNYAYSSGFYEVGQRGEYSTPMGTSSELAGSLFVCKRCMAISPNSITFENCNAATGSSTFSVDNRCIIPYRIYGIK